MKLTVRIGMYLLLICITFGAVWIPRRLNDQKEMNRMNLVFRQPYTPGIRPTFSEDRLAQLYYDRELGFSEVASSPCEKGEAFEVTLRQVICEILDEELCSFVIEGAEISPVSTRRSCLISVDHRPMALNFIYIENKEAPCIQLLYEEKTKTAIQIRLEGVRLKFGSLQELSLYVEAMELRIRNYYETQLKRKAEEYYCFLSVTDLSEKNPEGYFAEISIACGLLQYGDRIIFIEKENSEVVTK